MEFHEIADLFPMMDSVDLGKLAKDIQISGLRHPVVLYDGKVLDGRNRYRACGLAGITVRFTSFQGEWGDAVRLVTSENLERRHLTESQRAVVAIKLANLNEGRPIREKTASQDAVSQSSQTSQPSQVSQADAARQLGVSRSSVQRARRVVENGVPELTQAVSDGGLTVKEAADLTHLAPEVQRQALKEGRPAVKKAVDTVRATPRPPVTAGEISARRGRNTKAFLDTLMQWTRSLEGTNALLAAGDVPLDDHETEIALVAVERIRTGLDWLDTLLRGEGCSDDALAEWLSGKDK